MASIVKSSSKNVKCPECGSDKVFSDPTRAEVVCSKCGLVLEDKLMDFSQEWREFQGSGGGRSMRRTGAPMSFTRHDKGISTEIGHGFTDIFKLSANKRQKFFRLKKWQNRISTATERNAKYALAELKRYTSLLNLPPALEESAALMYRKILVRDLIRGRNIEAILSGVLYAVCRDHGVPRTLDEINEVTRVEKREIGRSFRLISRSLGMRILPTNPQEYIPRFASQLEFSEKVTTCAQKLFKEAKEKGVTSGRGPTGIAAAVLYIAGRIMNEPRTQREVAAVAGVTEVTIRNRYKEMVRELKIETKK